MEENKMLNRTQKLEWFSKTKTHWKHIITQHTKKSHFRSDKEKTCKKCAKLSWKKYKKFSFQVNVAS